MSLQPMPLSAMQLVSEDPIRKSYERVVKCDGGKGVIQMGLGGIERGPCRRRTTGSSQDFH